MLHLGRRSPSLGLGALVVVASMACSDDDDADAGDAIESGTSALAAGDCSSAAASFAGSDSAGARMGQAVARTMCLVEHPFVTRTLERIRIQRFRSTNFFGPQGILTDDDASHPLFDDDDAFGQGMSQAPASVTVDTIIQDSSDFSAEVQAIAALFESSSNSDATELLTIPAATFGLKDPIRLAPSDGLMAAAGMRAVAAALEMVRTYRVDVPLRAFCPQGDCDLFGAEAAALTQTLNEGLGDRLDRNFDGARAPFAAAIQLVIRGVDAAGPNSFVAKNSQTAALFDYIREAAVASRDSLDDGSQSMPRLSPAVTFDLRRLFAEVSRFYEVPVVAWGGELEFVESWFETLAQPYTNVFDAEPELTDPGDAIEAAAEALSDDLDAKVQSAPDPGACDDCLLECQEFIGGETCCPGVGCYCEFECGA